MGRPALAAAAALHLIGVSGGSPTLALAQTEAQTQPRPEPRPASSARGAAGTAVLDAQEAEMRGYCHAEDLKGFVEVLARSPELRRRRTSAFIRRVDDGSDGDAPSGSYADFPLEALDWNLIRRGSESDAEGPGHVLIRTSRQTGGGGHVYWFDAVYEGEPVGDSPGTLVEGAGPRGLLVFELAADNCWVLTQDIRGQPALWEFFGGALPARRAPPATSALDDGRSGSPVADPPARLASRLPLGERAGRLDR